MAKISLTLDDIFGKSNEDNEQKQNNIESQSTIKNGTTSATASATTSATTSATATTPKKYKTKNSINGTKSDNKKNNSKNKERKIQWDKKYNEKIKNNMTDRYIVRLIRREDKSISIADLKNNKELIDLYRLRLILKRELKND